MSLQQSITLAQMDVPRRYMVKPQLPWYRRFWGASPGPKPRLTEVTYRGPTPPQLYQTLRMIGEYRSDPLSFENMNLMRRYPVIKLGLVARAAPVMTALREARVECNDPKIAAFVKATIVDEWLLRLAQTAIIPSYIFGVAPHEKVWGYENVDIDYIDNKTGESKKAYQGEALLYKKIKFVHPESLDDFMIQEGSQDYAGFIQRDPKKVRRVEAYKSFTYANKFLYGGLWGESELTDIYPYWYYAEFFRALHADYLRFRVIPPIIGYGPPGIREDEDGNEIDNLEYGGKMLMAALENMVIMLPYEADDRGNNQWGYRELQLTNISDTLVRGIEELEVGMLRGLIVPERTVTQNMAAVGSYNQAEIHAERMVDAAKLETDNFLDAANKWIVPQVVEDNFGADAPKARIKVRAFSESLKEKLYNVVITLLQNDREGIQRRQVAFTNLLDQLNIPYVIGESGLPVPQEEPDQDEAETEIKEDIDNG